MRIAIDFRKATEANRAGKGEYVYQLVKSLVVKNLDTEFVLLTHPHQKIDLPAGNWKQKIFGGGDILWHLFVWLWLEFVRPVDLFFASTSAIVPALLRSVPSVTVLFDFTTWRFPATHLPRAVSLERIFLPSAIRFSRHLLAISEFTKQEAIDLFKVSPAKITTTLLAAEDVYKPLQLSESSKNSLRQKYGLPEKFVLFLGTIEPRKNIDFIIREFEQIKFQIPGTKLVLAGSKGWYAKQVLGSASDDIVLTGYIDKEDKPSLYNLASTFVFPSIYEGFGMPPLEAMACGTPTVVSNAASLPEVVQDGAIQIELKTEALSSALEKILNSSELRQELSQKGIARAKELTWENTAKVTIKVLKQYSSR